MTIPIIIGLIVLYVILGRSKFAMQRDPAYRRRVQNREEIRERHARNRRRRAKREADAKDSEGTQDDAASSGCA